MTTFLFLLDGVMIALLCFMSLQDERRGRGMPATSLFRFREGEDLRAKPRRRFIPGNYREDGAHDLGGKARR